MIGGMGDGRVHLPRECLVAGEPDMQPGAPGEVAGGVELGCPAIVHGTPIRLIARFPATVRSLPGGEKTIKRRRFIAMARQVERGGGKDAVPRPAIRPVRARAGDNGAGVAIPQQAQHQQGAGVDVAQPAVRNLHGSTARQPGARIGDGRPP